MDDGFGNGRGEKLGKKASPASFSSFISFDLAVLKRKGRKEGQKLRIRERVVEGNGKKKCTSELFG